MKTLIALKKLPIFKDATRFDILETKAEDLIFASLGTSLETVYGVFNLKSRKRSLILAIPDGEYLNLLNKSKIKIDKGHLTIKEPLILVKPGNEGTR
ncbi:MAG: hypothetical protein NTV44_00025 [Firmicutes bacterium]|nr:hypothetical protein [Bacillota bacterium]